MNNKPGIDNCRPSLPGEDEGYEHPHPQARQPSRRPLLLCVCGQTVRHSPFGPVARICQTCTDKLLDDALNGPDATRSADHPLLDGALPQHTKVTL